MQGITTVSVSEWGLPQPPVLGGQFCLGDYRPLCRGVIRKITFGKMGHKTPPFPLAPRLFTA